VSVGRCPNGMIQNFILCVCVCVCVCVYIYIYFIIGICSLYATSCIAMPIVHVINISVEEIFTGNSRVCRS
jgi:hypothetical protein